MIQDIPMSKVFFSSLFQNIHLCYTVWFNSNFLPHYALYIRTTTKTLYKITKIDYLETSSVSKGEKGSLDIFLKLKIYEPGVYQGDYLKGIPKIQKEGNKI